ncbi:hypothetical protein EPN90_02910 [Patescibacteria group bacterium]|nr:MAG: hypothetical protein EPN90_02910 [Patescibacteria group bacterium]
MEVYVGLREKFPPPKNKEKVEVPPWHREDGELLTVENQQYIVIRRKSPELIRAVDARSVDKDLKERLREEADLAIARARAILQKPDSDYEVSSGVTRVEVDLRPERAELVFLVPISEIPESRRGHGFVGQF